jgi:SAM-dependent methyltransferase
MPDFERLYYEDEVHWEGEALLDEANQERIRFTADMIPSDTKSLLDAGCGNGIFVNFLKDQKPGLRILAVDRSATALKYVQTEKMEGDVSHLPVSDRLYDCVTCLEVIEHLPVMTYERTLEELARVSNEYIIISVPYREKLEKNHNQCPSCETIFNYDLHLRNFDDEKINHLLDKKGFSCLERHYLGMSLQYKWHYTFRKIFYKEQFRQWKSPICPLCGYQEVRKPSSPAPNAVMPVTVLPKRKLISYLSGLIKLFWPKGKKYYWIIALYKRK